jgi:hypothetical protein
MYYYEFNTETKEWDIFSPEGKLSCSFMLEQTAKDWCAYANVEFI